MTDRYRCGPDSNWQDKMNDKKMIWSSDSKPGDTKMMMQANSTGGDMSQYDSSWGLTTRLKYNEACERSDDLGEGGYAPVCNSRESTTRSKSEWNLRKVQCSQREGMPQYVMMNRQRCKMPQNYCTLRYAHPSCNENIQPWISNAKQDHVSWHHADKTKLTDE